MISTRNFNRLRNVRGLRHALGRNLAASTVITTDFSTNKQRIVVVGGVAGGATAAARAMRLNNQLDVTVVERSPDVSFANCGLPYYIGGEIKDRSKLALQTPESLSHALGIKVLTNTDVFKIHRDQKKVSIRNLKGETQDLPYDKLILSPGASPLKPPVEGINDRRVLTLRNLQDMDKIAAQVKQANVKRVAVIGAGFIGLEVAEQLQHIGKKVALHNTSRLRLT
jgi:NADPH-dependent 2,4-dienoyl-CoA reductase/sulfur reductase-like enzyme